ncbi:hypothetical protein Q0F99_18030 [Rathayibacter oskolensis]|uniref:hypothetical protein n=1 Tax=Rathayibacter oskolensis TaxID=1891671 RepID=UPI00265FB56F|nr:hypothetical protein [Rathayibacter oskolensis]WKK71319.1 hypothetical protein Q0F99_18030 [Rathayibacter oskolensis]
MHDRRGQRCRAAGGRGADEIRATGLLLRPGVPDGEEAAREGGGHREERHDQEREERTLTRTGGQPPEQQDHGIRGGGREQRGPVGLRSVGAGDAGVGGPGEGGRAEDPDGELHRVAAQAQAQQRRDGAHGAP